MSVESSDGRVVATRGAWLDVQQPGPTPRVERLGRQRRVSAISLLFLLAVMITLIGLAVTMQATDYNIWGAFLVAPVLLLLTVPFATSAARRDRDPRIGRLILMAAVIKLSIGTGLRYMQTTVLYKGSDATAYIREGVLLAPQFRQWKFGDLGSLVGTRFIEVTTGLVVAVVNETSLGLYVVYSWFAFVGLCLFYQAFRLAFPEGNHRRYALLLFFWPSMLFWPSSVGKDALMMLTLGLSALGIANLIVGRFRGFIWLGIGTFGCVMVRPHLSLLTIGGFAIALFLRRNRGSYTRLLARPIGTFILIIGMVVASLVLFAQTSSFFKLDALDFSSAQTVLDNTASQTSEGGSQFTVADPTTPLGYVEATVTILLRPFPFELAPGLGTVAGLEGVLMAGLIAVSWRRIVRIPAMMLRNAYVAFAAGYSAAFIFGFSSISNFGILARERVQLFPVLFILFAIPKVERTPRPRLEEASGAVAV
ncbi:MAG: hypothetical protein QOD92_3772 [Acidimicrobiaceae bacterium]